MLFPAKTLTIKKLAIFLFFPPQISDKDDEQVEQMKL